MRVAFGLGVLVPVLALAQQGPMAVEVAPVQRRPVELTQPLVASVEPVVRATLAAEVAGLVAERAFDEGQFLEKGAVLARLKTDLLEAHLTAAVAAQNTAEANVSMASAEAENAANELERNKELVRREVGSDKELRDAATKARVSAAMVKSRQAEVEEKKAEVARLKLMIEKSEVNSPVPGVVQKRYVESGQWLKEGDPVADIVQLDPLWVRIHVPERVVSRLTRGDEAKVTIDALDGLTLIGKVDQVLPEADAASRSFAVKLLVPNPEGKIRPGFFARASLLSKSQSQWVVPKDAVVSRGPEAHVVVVREGKAVIVPVKRGAAEGASLVAVTGDVKENDQVVTRGNEALRGGEPLLVPPPAATAPTTAATAASASK